MSTSASVAGSTPRSLAVAVMVQRALNLVDVRLVDHGLRVAVYVDAMLDLDRSLGPEDRRDAFLIALFHDIGAYRTEEIDRMVDFETETVWEHSAYGYLFLRELSPLSRMAEAVLYHHAPCDTFDGVEPTIAHVAKILHVADRVDVFALEFPDASRKKLHARLRQGAGHLLDSEAVELFCAADEVFDLASRIAENASVGRALAAYPIIDVDAPSFLEMLVHVIDFRSRHTVAHTMTTAQIAFSLALRLGDADEDLGAIYNGGLVHDLGKIGVPLEILEKPGKLTEAEQAIMRTHVELTERIIDGCVCPQVARIALRHHEKLDGSGYPHGLAASDLTELERIVAVADIVSALAGTRSYKEAYGRKRVVSIVGDMASEGLIDRTVASVLIGEYDAIMEEVRHVCAPIMSAYERIQEEYGTLIAKLV